MLTDRIRKQILVQSGQSFLSFFPIRQECVHSKYLIYFNHSTSLFPYWFRALQRLGKLRLTCDRRVIKMCNLFLFFIMLHISWVAHTHKQSPSVPLSPTYRKRERERGGGVKVCRGTANGNYIAIAYLQFSNHEAIRLLLLFAYYSPLPLLVVLRCFHCSATFEHKVNAS
jgi:hypothetical protein